MKVVVTSDIAEAYRLVAEGYIPVEASYGSETVHDLSRSDPLLTLDHHGPLSDLECPAIRAQKEMWAKGLENHRAVGCYVLSHIDADSFLTVMGLEGYRLPMNFIERVAFVDIHGRHKIPEDQQNHPDQIRLSLLNDLLNRRKGFGHDEFRRAIQILLLPDDSQTIKDKIEKLKVRRERILANCFVMDKIAIGISDEYPLDILYELRDFAIAYHYIDRYITIGCRDMETGLAYEGFLEDGLKKLWSMLGSGWGGRETIGGSPRGERMDLQQTYDAAIFLQKWLGEKHE